ncbi:hypothetical protein [Haloprofundus salinisoli]|uniref:hypothetical protein n=1 Tax=Haloprofundus salinisoli TaxID=2876193 RepID=UPI001CCEF828|nr:hypothetical protein [Haloprofundus salinisoli]
MTSHDSLDSSKEMTLYGTAQHETETNTPERVYGPPRHETMTGPYPCSGSELARPTVTTDFDGDDVEESEPPTGEISRRETSL